LVTKFERALARSAVAFGAFLEAAGKSDYRTHVSMNVEWDPKKAKSNVADHGVTFEDASGVFLDPLSLTIPDPDHSFDENRFITMGQSTDGQLLVVVHTDRGNNIRIISARFAEPHERRAYESGE
jgi:uncharacterized DUF497 family protein